MCVMVLGMAHIEWVTTDTDRTSSFGAHMGDLHVICESAFD